MNTKRIDYSPVTTTAHNKDERREYIVDKKRFGTVVGVGAAATALAVGSALAFGEHQPIEETTPSPYVEVASIGDRIADGEDIEGVVVNELPIDEGESIISATTDWAREQLAQTGEELTSDQENIITGTAIEAQKEFDEILRPGATVKVFRVGDNFGVSEVVENGPIDTGN